MAKFPIKSKDVQFANKTTHKTNPGNIEVCTGQLQVKVVVAAELEKDEAYYLGYIQVCTKSDERNDYGKDVQQRWEFSKTPISDSDAEGNIPWYGVGDDPFISGSRRIKLVGPIKADQSLSMSDHLEMTVAKFETLADGKAGPNMLNRIELNQSFSLWLVAVDVNQADKPEHYQKLLQIDWTYMLDGTVSFGDKAGLTLTTDNPVYVDKSDKMDKIPAAAFKAPIANDNEELVYYLNGVKKHVIVKRKS
jgi:hypothetical protein